MEFTIDPASINNGSLPFLLAEIAHAMPMGPAPIITVCSFTTDPTPAPLFRLPVEPGERNGLRVSCSLMVDKITTVPKTKIGNQIGRLDDEDLVRLNRAVLVFLGFAGSRREK